MGIITAAWAAGTVYLFRHPSDLNFATWCGLCVTMAGVYHWLNNRDQKEPDACSRH